MQQASIFQQRRAGVLLHITSLPSGSLGEDAYRFVDFLHQAGVSVWQMLPLGPTHADGSPYQCLSAHAANSKLLCLDTLKQQSWAKSEDLNEAQTFSTLMAHAYRQFVQYADETALAGFVEFQQKQSYWLDDYVLFSELRYLNHATAWFDWPADLRDRKPEALAKVREERQEALNIRKFAQYMFFEQWYALKRYANERGVMLFGDMPIFVAHDSADVWASPELFTLDALGQPELVAGVPPDYFSETGQRWGNPLYRWQSHIEQDFVWWQQRMQTQLDMFDLIRIDHFRGFEACWEIPASCETAIDGKWVEAPGDALFEKLLNTFGELPLVAEDLGIITEQVTALRVKYGFPGMKILQFAFGGGADNPYLPHQHCEDSVSYTGTHDNDTTIGWYHSIDDATRQHVHDYLGLVEPSPAWMLIKSALQTVSQMAVVPMQDILELGGEHRMNVPGTAEGNWSWRFDWDMLADDSAEKLKRLNDLYGRS